MSGVAEPGRDGDGRLKRRRTGAAFAGRQCLSEYPPRLDGCLWERLIVLRSTATGEVASDVWGMMCGCVGQGEVSPSRSVAAVGGKCAFGGSERSASVEEGGWCGVTSLWLTGQTVPTSVARKSPGD